MDREINNGWTVHKWIDRETDKWIDRQMKRGANKLMNKENLIKKTNVCLQYCIFCFLSNSRASKIKKELKNISIKWFNRLAVLEARARKRSSLVWTFYLPVIFFAYGVLLGKR